MAICCDSLVRKGPVLSSEQLLDPKFWTAVEFISTGPAWTRTGLPLFTLLVVADDTEDWPVSRLPAVKALNWP